MSREGKSKAQQAILGGKLLEMVAAGKSIRKSAEELGLPRQTAFQYYQRALRTAAEETEGLREQLLHQELETLRQITEAHMPRAREGDEKSANVVLRASAQRAKLLGMEEALKIEVQSNKVDGAVAQIMALLDSGKEVDHEALRVLQPEAGGE